MFDLKHIGIDSCLCYFVYSLVYICQVSSIRFAVIRLAFTVLKKLDYLRLTNEFEYTQKPKRELRQATDMISKLDNTFLCQASMKRCRSDSETTLVVSSSKTDCSEADVVSFQIETGCLHNSFVFVFHHQSY